MLLSLAVLAFIFITGLCIGSFLNVVILRTVSGESIVFPASKCPKCQNPLKWYHNIPVLSYLFLRGKCAFCKEHISIQYPIVELLTGLLFIGLFLKCCSPFDEFFGLSVINPINPVQIATYIFLLIISCLFIAIAGTDILEKKVADIHTIPVIILGVLYSLVFTVLMFVSYYKSYGMPKINFEFIISSPLVITFAIGLMGFLFMEALSLLGLVTVGARAFGEGDSYIAGGIGTVFAALLTCSINQYYPFLPIFQSLLAIIILAGVLQFLFTLPIYIKKLASNKNWVSIGCVCGFIIYAVSYFFAQYLNWLDNRIAYWSSTAVLLVLGIFTCKEILSGLRKNNAQDALYLPFGPALILSAFIAIFAFIY